MAMEALRVRIPVVADGDTGHGNFNNVRRFVRKLGERGVGGVCIEDKLFPKANSFIGDERLYTTRWKRKR